MSSSTRIPEDNPVDVVPELSLSIRIFAKSLNFKELVDGLGIKASRTHRAADRDILGKPFGRDMWALESALPRSASLEEHIGWLNSVLECRVEFLHRVSQNADVSIVCSYRAYETDQGGFSLSPAALAILYKLHVRVEVHLLFI